MATLIPGQLTINTLSDALGPAAFSARVIVAGNDGTEGLCFVFTRFPGAQSLGDWSWQVSS